MRKLGLVLVLLFWVVLSFGEGITTKIPREKLEVIPVSEGTSPYIVEMPSPKISTLPSLADTYAIDSVTTVLSADEAVYFKINLDSNTINFIDDRPPLPSVCYEALDSVPKWLRHDLFQSFKHINAASSDTASRLARVIINAPWQERDEVAFCVAHMSVEALTDPRFDPNLLRKNADWIYRLADSLRYVRIEEHGTHANMDWYTTTSYRVVSASRTDTSWFTIPPDIYYWFVVHPKLSDEAPKDRDLPSDDRQRTFGYFWREYLWTDPDTSHSYTAGGYPLLSNIMRIPIVAWVRRDTSLPSTRTIGPENSALDVLGWWVSKILPDRPTTVRPIQPNQIAYIHRGNCGEVQDLLAAGGRTALLPIDCVGSLLQDHVWNEFWDSVLAGELLPSDVWHTYQVDRWGGNTRIVMPEGGYDHDRGGSKNLSSVIAWRGDGFMFNRAPAYTRVCTLVVQALDRNNHPVPGAHVLFASTSLYDSTHLYVADIRVTGVDGKVVIEMGDSNVYYYRIDSPVGNYPTTPRTVDAFPTLGSRKAVAGAKYTVSKRLSGELPSLNVTTTASPSRVKQILVDFSAPKEYIRGPGIFDSQEGTYSFKRDSGVVSVFVCDSANFELYRAGSPFTAYAYQSRAKNGRLVVNVPATGTWYVVVSEEEIIVNDYLVKATVVLGRDLILVDENSKPLKPQLSVIPNPFNANCRIKYSLPCEGKIEILDLSGRVILSREIGSRGELVWNASGNTSGIYIIRASAGSVIMQKKVALIK